MNLDLSTTPGLHYAALVNPAGQIMDTCGRMEGDPAIAAILTQAAMSAAIDLGQRGGLGECRDMALTYANGGVFAAGTADGHVLIFQHSASSPVELLRQRAREILKEWEEPADQEAEAGGTGDSSRLMDALNAGQP